MNRDVSCKEIAKLVVIIFILGAVSACQEKINTNKKTDIIRPVKIIKVKSLQGVKIRTFPAIIEASEKTDLAFKVAGQLIRLPVNAGTKVKQGQLLAQVDSSDYQLALEDRIAKLNLVKVQHKQSHTLFKKNFASQAEIDSIDAQLKTAQVSVKQAKANMSYTQLKAPFAGEVAHVNVDNYQYVQTQQSIVQLQNTTKLDVHFNVPESMVKSSRQTDAYKSLCGVVKLNDGSNSGKEFKACYKEHDSIPDTRTRAYPVVFTLDNPRESMLLPGMSVDLTLDHSSIALANNMSGFLIPIESVFDENEQQWVWKLDNNMQLIKTPISVADISQNMIRVTEGLQEDDKIISAGVSYLSEGQKVRPFSKERGL